MPELAKAHAPARGPCAKFNDLPLYDTVSHAGQGSDLVPDSTGIADKRLKLSWGIGALGSREHLQKRHRGEHGRGSRADTGCAGKPSREPASGTVHGA